MKIKSAIRMYVEHFQNYKNSYISGSSGTDINSPLIIFYTKAKDFVESNIAVSGTAQDCAHTPKIAEKMLECGTNIAYHPLMVAALEPTMGNFLATLGIITYVGIRVLQSKRR